MDITLEKIDQVIERTGVEYEIAKEALLFAQGDVLEAIVYIETLKNYKENKKSESKYNDMLDFVKEMIKRGTITRVIVEKDGKVVIDIPVIAGIIGTIAFTGAAFTSVMAALILGCDLKVVKKDGEIIDIKEYTKKHTEAVKSKFSKEQEDDECCCGDECDGDGCCCAQLEIYEEEPDCG